MQSLLLRYYDPVRGKVTFDGQGASICVCISEPARNGLRRHSRIYPEFVAEYYWHRAAGPSLLSNLFALTNHFLT